MVPNNDSLERPEIVVVGAACLDVKGRLPGGVVAGTSNPGIVRISIGGCARNVAENLARLGLNTMLLSAVADDSFGQAITRQTMAAGVNTQHMLVTSDRHSAAYIALLDWNGTLIVGVDDTEAIADLTPAYIAAHAHMLAHARHV